MFNSSGSSVSLTCVRGFLLLPWLPFCISGCLDFALCLRFLFSRLGVFFCSASFLGIPSWTVLFGHKHKSQDKQNPI